MVLYAIISAIWEAEIGEFEASLGKNTRPYQNKLKQKGLGAGGWLKWYRACKVSP
jgi:hypothetical protein